MKLNFTSSASGEFRCPECKQPFWKKDVHLHHEIDQIINLCQETLPKFESGFNMDDKHDIRLSMNDTVHSPDNHNDNLEISHEQCTPSNDRDVAEKTPTGKTVETVEDLGGEDNDDDAFAPLFHTPPDKDHDVPEPDPDSFVTASNESPNQLAENADFQHSGAAVSSCKTLNLDPISEPYSELNAIFDESNDGDLPFFDLNAGDESSVESNSNSDAVKVQEMLKVSLPTTPIENVSQKSCHVKPVERTYSRRNKHNPKVAAHNTIDESSPVSNWLKNSVLFDGTDQIEADIVQKLETREASISSSIEQPLNKISKESVKNSKVVTQSLVKKSTDENSSTIMTRSRVSSSSSLKSIDVMKTPVIKRKSTENNAKSKRMKRSPATMPQSETKTSFKVNKTPRSANKTAGRTPKTPSSTPRNKRNQKGETLLHRAAINGDIDKLKLLLMEDEIDVNSKDNAGWTPLHEACIKQHVDCAKLLLKHGAQVNAKAENLDTPLHDACSKNALHIIELLLDNGACKTLKNMDGCTPVDYAQSDRALQLLDKATDTKNLSVLDEDLSSDNFMEDFVIAFSGVPNAQFGKYQKMKGLPFKLAEEVTGKVTHLVCVLDENKCCKRTMKFLSAMALGVMIVSVEWLEESCKSSTWLNASEYMVRGAVNSDKYAPCRSFSDQKKGIPRLFTGLTFYIDKKTDSKKLNKETICGLVQSANGQLVSRAPKEAAIQKTKVYHAKEDSILHSQSTIIISDCQNSSELLVKSTNWILDCISSYKLID